MQFTAVKTRLEGTAPSMRIRWLGGEAEKIGRAHV